MPFIPHTAADVEAMLTTIGVDSIAALFDEIPKELLSDKELAIPVGLSEMQLNRLIEHHTATITNGICFIGGGAYEHHIPAAVWDITSRGEFLTAYTPYQAEASQGTLQLLFEYQSMMASLTAMEVSNASLYDGASALAEAVLMAMRINRKATNQRILVAGTLHPHYLQTLTTIVNHQDSDLIKLPFSPNMGTLDVTALAGYEASATTAVVIPQPNFFGSLEEVNLLTDWAHAQGALVIACVNPTALAILTPPGEWGTTGADIVCGEGQPLGIPLASGGPYFGFLCCRKAHVRQMPGRLIGKTVDTTGKVGFSLTLQAREQHIRRAKATSNICTNQGLLVTAATIYMSLLGPQGLAQVASECHYNTQQLLQQLLAIDGVTKQFTSSFFHESVINVRCDPKKVLTQLLEVGIAGGIALGDYFPEFKNSILVCATETKTAADLALYASALDTILNKN